MFAIDVDNVSRTFNHNGTVVTALDGVDLSVSVGECVALLGKNGAGKTTLTKILATLLLPSSGSARIMGKDVATHPEHARAATSAVFGGDRGFYPMLSGRENLRYHAALAGLAGTNARSRIAEAVQAVGLELAQDRPVEQYSKGMKQRLHIAAGMLKQAPVMLLDEPTVGLDPVEAQRLRESVAASVQSGTTVLLTSHNLHDVEALAHRVVLLDDGVIRMTGSVANFRALAGFTAVVTATVPEASKSELAGIKQPVDVTLVEHGHVHINVKLPDWGTESVAIISQVHSIPGVLEVAVRSATLDESFAAFFAQKNEEAS